MTAAVEDRRGRLVVLIALASTVAVISVTLTGVFGESAAAGETAQASKVATVGIAGFAYHPPTLTIARGSTVRFSNTSGTAHTASRKGSFDTGRIKPGRSVSIQFAQKGTFAYHCKIHPFMKGKIVVD